MAFLPGVTPLTAPAVRRLLRRLGLLGGGLAGLAMAAGAWGLETVSAATAHMTWTLPSLIAGIVLTCLLGSLAGWLTVRIDSALAGGLTWFGAAMVMTVIIGYLPYTGRTLTIWLMDPRFGSVPVTWGSTNHHLRCS